MSSLQVSRLLHSSSCSSTRTRSAISVPKLPKIPVSFPKIPTRAQNFVIESDGFRKTIPLPETKPSKQEKQKSSVSTETSKLYAILEEVINRIEMHKNIGEQRNNWNSLMLNSINFITLTAATMAGIATTDGCDSLLALKISSTLLLSSAAVMLAVMNKIQPSQLVEEQRNATRLFTQLKAIIETALAIGDVDDDNVKDAMERVLAIDRAYPLPLMGTMLEKFPKEFRPAAWWPNNSKTKTKTQKGNLLKNASGWDKDLLMEMRQVVRVVKTKDMEDYKRLGNMALKLNKALAISGPVLTGISAICSAFISSSSPNGSFCATAAVMACASLAAVINTLEHGGQVGMVFEMYRNTAGFFSQLEESIESTTDDSGAEDRENGAVFEMKVAMKLGRSLSELRDLARKSSLNRTAIDEFASKLF